MEGLGIPDWYNGNIDLNKRKVYNAPEGYIQTEESIDVAFDPGDKYTIRIPKVINGNKPVTPEEARAHFLKTGEHLGYSHRQDGESVEDFYKRVGAMSNALHQRQDKYYNGLGSLKE